VSAIHLREGVLGELCQEYGIPRAELSRRMGIEPKTAWRIEFGHNDPSPKFIAALMNLTERPFEELFEIVDTEAVPA
jgi:transcriptional regulator with XRE-family HTH domain